MKRFSDFAAEQVALDGDKARLDDILNAPVVVTGFRIRKTRYSKNDSGEYLTLQFEREGKRWIVFTGSDVLIGQIKQYGDEIPFETVIRKINRYYAFT